MLDINDYVTGVQRVVGPELSELVRTLLGLCNVQAPDRESLDKWIDDNDGTELSMSRTSFNLIEGCCAAIDEVVNARIECYNPCINLFDRLNKVLYNNYKYSTGRAHNKEEWENFVVDTDGFSRFTNATTCDELFVSMCEALCANVYKNYSYITVILYAEAVLLFRFDRFWSFQRVDIQELKSAIAGVKQGSRDKLKELFFCNLDNLVESENESRTGRVSLNSPMSTAAAQSVKDMIQAPDGYQLVKPDTGMERPTIG